MPHQFQSINCKKCNHHYCPVCEDRCPKCGEVDISDEKTMETRAKMKTHMNQDKKHV